MSFIAKVRFWIDISYRMLRIRTVVLMAVFATIGYEAVRPTGALSTKYFLTIIMLAALYMSATSFNDIADEEVDKVNLAHDKSRPLITTMATPQQLKRLGIISLLVALGAAVAISPSYLLFIIAGTVLNVGYSLPPLKISHRGILAALWLPISYVVVPFLAGALLQGWLNHLSWYLLAAMYVSFIGRIILKDFRDYEGDKQFGKLNFLVRHGPRPTCAVAGLAWLGGDIIFIMMMRRSFPLMTAFVQPLMAAILYALYRLAYERQYQKQLRDVAFVGRVGNAISLTLLTVLTLQAFPYGTVQKNLTTLSVGIFMALVAINLWREEWPEPPPER